MARLNWGMIGGGEGSQIGPAHRISAGMDGLFTLAAGALDVDPQRGKAFAEGLGIAPDRAYGNWREMLDGERGRDDRVDLVTVATPNATHYEITKAFLENGFHVLCEKPMTMNAAEAEDIVATAQKAGRICAVNYGYSGYPMVRHMRAMVKRGDLGAALNVAIGMGAYTITDRATWIGFANKRDFTVLVEGDEALFNQYGVVLVSPERCPNVDALAGRRFIDWLLSDAGQAAIAGHRIDDRQLFFPNAPR